MYNHSSFSCRIVKFQLRMFKFVFILQVIVGPLALVSCDILCLLFVRKNKNSELLRLINLASQKGKRIASVNTRLHENSVRLNGNKVFV